MPNIVPLPNELTKPFWDACKNGRLIVQECNNCNRMQNPPEDQCWECDSSDNLIWREVQGRGIIDGYVVIYDSRLEAFWDQQPYNVAIINLLENPEIKFFSNLPGTPVDQVPIGSEVQVEFEQVAPDQFIPQWRVV